MTILPHILACATCTSSGSEEMTRAAGMTVLFMLAILLIVIGGCLRFIWFLAKAEKNAVRAKVPVPSEQPQSRPKDHY